ncbi:MAG: YihY/virulence factor BrkB family protein [Bryobacteraceae bacterium]
MKLQRVDEYRPWWARIRPTVGYLLAIEAHVFALAIAASVLLSFFPFLMVMISFFRDVLHWKSAVSAIYLAIRDAFPGAAGDVVAQNLQPWMVPRLHWASMFLLLLTSNGIFEPLEVALNRTWGVTQNRSYWKNQVVSLGMVFACGALVLVSLMLSALSAEWATSWLGNGATAAWLTMLLTKLAAVPLTILALFLIYWLLPNRKIDPARVVKDENAACRPRRSPRTAKGPERWRFAPFARLAGFASRLASTSMPSPGRAVFSLSKPNSARVLENGAFADGKI